MIRDPTEVSRASVGVDIMVGVNTDLSVLVLQL